MPQTAFTTSSVNFRSSDNSTIDGLCYAKVSDPRVGNRDRMFIGADGSLSFYSLHEDTTMNTNDSMALGSSFQMIFEDTVRISKSKKYSCNYMQFVPSKHMLIAIIDDVIMSYDVISLQLITQILDTKGVSKFNYHEESGILVCNIKKKVMVYTFSGAGFIPKKEISMTETPRFLKCISGAVIIGYKSHYEMLAFSNYSSSHLLDFEREHTMVGCEMPAIPDLKPARILLSIGLQGVLLDSSQSIKTVTFHERVVWSTTPEQVALTQPYHLISLQRGFLEVHDLITLQLIQTIVLESPLRDMTAKMTIYDNDNGQECILVGGGEVIQAFSMVPMLQQLDELMEMKEYETALNIHHYMSSKNMEVTIDVREIHNKYAISLYNMADFEPAVSHFIKAETPLLLVFALFPDFIPQALQESMQKALHSENLHSMSLTSIVNPSSTQISRAANAVVQLCNHYRKQIVSHADRAQQLQEQDGVGIMSSGGNTMNAEEVAVFTAKILDSSLLSSLVACVPDRKGAVIALLKEKNRCDVDGGALCLSSQGNAYFDALLWLYRSNNEHKRCLQNLDEKRCIQAANWTQEQYYLWITEYLRFLWYSDSRSWPLLTLKYLPTVLQYNPHMGLSILINRPKANLTFGGKGVTVQDVLSVLENTVIPDSNKPDFTVESLQSPSLSFMVLNAPNRERKTAAVIGGIKAPLLEGRAIGISYLEWLVSSQAAPSSMHDEFLNLLIAAIHSYSQDLDNQQTKNNYKLVDIDESDTDSVLLYKIYRRKLHYFLQVSNKYNIDKALNAIPSHLQYERALILSKKGKYEEVLTIFMVKLRDFSVASAYCDMLYGRRDAAGIYSGENMINRHNHYKTDRPPDESDALGQKRDKTVDTFFVTDLAWEGYDDIYHALLKIILNPEIDFASMMNGSTSNTPPPPPSTTIDTDGNVKPGVDENTEKKVKFALRIAETYFMRIDPTIFFDLLPGHIPMSWVTPYADKVKEYKAARKRNLEVTYQLMRMREVNVMASKEREENARGAFKTGQEGNDV